MILRNSKTNDNPPTEFLYGPLHGTKMRIVGEPAEMLFIIHGRRVVYIRVVGEDDSAAYYDADEWYAHDDEPYTEREGVKA